MKQVNRFGSQTSIYGRFQNDSSEVFQQIAERMETIPEETGVEKMVKKGGIAYIMDVSAVDYMYRKDCQQLHMAQRMFSVNGLGLALPQGDRCKDAVNSMYVWGCVGQYVRWLHSVVAGLS